MRSARTGRIYPRPKGETSGWPLEMSEYGTEKGLKQKMDRVYILPVFAVSEEVNLCVSELVSVWFGGSGGLGGAGFVSFQL